MKKSPWQALMLLLFLALGLAYGGSRVLRMEQPKEESAAVETSDENLPVSLDALYPPQTKDPVYLFKKLEMSMPFSGIPADLFEGDLENALADLEKFKALYAEVSKMVPEWTQRFPMSPVDNLGAALKSGDQEKVMAALEKTGQVCYDCHVSNMPRVQHKYHWGNFQAITAKDPLMNQELPLKQLMMNLDASFVGVYQNFEQGQVEQAKKQLQGFKARFGALKDTCGECHGTEERKYYVDAGIQAMIDKVEKALASPKIDPKQFGKLFMDLGMKSCHKCHLTHIPAAYAQAREKM